MMAEPEPSDSVKPRTVAAEALITAAGVVDELYAGMVAHYGEDDAHLGPERTYRTAWDRAYDYNVDADTAGGRFDRVEDLFSEVILEAREQGLSGEDAAESYRDGARAILRGDR